ncbi:Mcm2-7 hexameric complex component [Irineochytrium annulatum]|nr:Mcm2-7 hexameric complex component [Irineochytrium annulatum]
MAINVNYKTEKERISLFLSKFTSTNKNVDDNGVLRPKYELEMEAVANRTKTCVFIDLDDVAAFQPDGESLARNIEQNTRRYLTLFCECFDEQLPPTNRMREAVHWKLSYTSVVKEMPRWKELRPRSKQKALSIRDIKGSYLGSLVTVRGIVTRASNVKPHLVVMGLTCDRCGNEIFQSVSADIYTPLSECPTEECKQKGSKGKLYMQTRASKFDKFQEVRIQELADQVPMGHIPRSMVVHMTEEMTRLVSPGDVVYITGIFLPTPYVGFNAVRAGLITNTYLEAQHVVHLKQQYSQMELTQEVSDTIRSLTQVDDLYGYLARSIAPEIFGHLDIKKALLLLLVGGTTKETADGMKIRGDLNVCLMGDPGVAKSQLLKYISKIAPRGVYTTGRGSSGVGLTASVMRDPVTDEMVLEGGALVLADNGIACIDEFDKMDENDRTAIHEVMEQQTISISKAGITTTLNARTSILAAANPQFGRYDTRKRPTENINLPAALLSRFDLLFLILDKPNLDDDMKLAEHVTHVHIHNRHPNRNNEREPLEVNIMHHYIAVARTVVPLVTKETSQYLVNAYINIRRSGDEGASAELQYSTPRTLLSLIRMATALTTFKARLRFSEEVEIGDVEEALRLMEISKSSVNETNDTRGEDKNSQIYKIIRNMAREGQPEGGLAELDLASIKDRVILKHFSVADLEECITTYENNNVWMRTRNNTALAFVDHEDEDDIEDDE